MDVRQKIINYLKEHEDIALDTARSLNSWNGSFEFVETYDIEELAQIMAGYDLARAIIYGNVHDIDNPVRFTVYGNLETVWQSDLELDSKDYAEDITDCLLDNHMNIFIYDKELEALIDEYESEDD